MATHTNSDTGLSRLMAAMTNPYESPRGSGAKTNQTFFSGVFLLVVGLSIPVVGLTMTVLSMMYSNSQLAASPNASPNMVAASISRSLFLTLIAFIIGFISALFGVVLMFRSRRERHSSGIPSEDS